MFEVGAVRLELCPGCRLKLELLMMGILMVGTC